MTVTKMVFVKQRGKNAYLAMTIPLEIMTKQMILTGSHGKSTRICMIVCRLILRQRRGREIMSRYLTKGMIVRARKSRLDLVLIIMSWFFTFHVLHPCK